MLEASIVLARVRVYPIMLSSLVKGAKTVFSLWFTSKVAYLISFRNIWFVELKPLYWLIHPSKPSRESLDALSKSIPYEEQTSYFLATFPTLPNSETNHGLPFLAVWSFVVRIIAFAPREGILSLPRQKQWQININFTTLLLFNYNSKLDCKNYSKNEQDFIAYLAVF